MTDKHVMIDIETLGTGPMCVVPQIAVGVFDLSKREFCFDAVFMKRIDIRKYDHHFNIEPSTLWWWSTQDQMMFQKLFLGKEHPYTVLEGMSNFIKRFVSKYPKEVTVWAKPPSFDLKILEAMMNHYQLDWPWHWCSHRDVRTIQHFLPDGEFTKSPAAHDALSDIEAQAYDVHRAFQHTGKL